MQLKEGYKRWAGFSTPIGNIRPVDAMEDTSAIGHGLPRPIRHTRKGRDLGGRMNCREISTLMNLPGSENVQMDPSTMSAQVCIPGTNPDRQIRRRTYAANTVINRKYSTTLQQHREKKCRTFDQSTTHYETNPLCDKLSLFYNCNSIVYKPNNIQYAQQGAVSSSTRLLKLANDTRNKTPAIPGKKNQPVIASNHGKCFVLSGQSVGYPICHTN